MQHFEYTDTHIQTHFKKSNLVLKQFQREKRFLRRFYYTALQNYLKSEQFLKKAYSNVIFQVLSIVFVNTVLQGN